MDNNYNDFNGNNNDVGNTNSVPDPNEVNNTSFDPTNTQNDTTVNDPVTNKAEEHIPADSTENTDKSSESGEYHYRGSQMGDFGKENTSGTGYTNPYRQGNHQENGQNTQQNYGQNGNPYNGQNGNPYGGPYRLHYGPEGNWNHYPEGGNFPPFTPPPENNGKKKHRPGKGISGAAIAVTCVVCILLSAAAGFGGSYLYSVYGSNTAGITDTSGGNTAVLHRVVETDESTSTGEKGIYTDVTAIVKDSVVEITTEFQVTGFFQYVSEGAGSGVIISEDGYIITNNHVISDTSSGDTADSITVRLTNGNEYKASVVGKDADYDIAVIKITPDEELAFAVFGDSDKLTVGEEVIAVGNPLGELGGTVTNGIISALDREISVDGTSMNLLQTNAAINPGNSGGGLFNMNGELIGIVNAKSSGSGIEGLGFAIPSNDAFSVAEQLMENGYVSGKTYLGVYFSDISDVYTAYKYFKTQSTGVYVYKLEEGYNDGVLKYGDRIVAVEGNEITATSQIKDLIKEYNVGDKLKFTLYRNGKLIEVEVTCYEYVPSESQTVDFEGES